MDQDNDSPETKLTRTKRKWAADGKFLTGRHARPETERLPPGQHLVRDWPVLDLGLTPQVTVQSFRLDITGAIDRPASWTFEAFRAQPQSQIVSDIHCVTTWSRYRDDAEPTGAGVAARGGALRGTAFKRWLHDQSHS